MTQMYNLTAKRVKSGVPTLVCAVLIFFFFAILIWTSIGVQGCQGLGLFVPLG